ncbi:hypothetical protein OAM96_05775 [Candidatus Poseidoniaceae archaeon]|nr:hypothetical protein [Candidatus Poseidoniaceae archaeon]
MSQSMARKLPLNGFGNCVTYGEANDMGIGLPLEIDENRPLVIAHPAAGNYHHASMSLFEDAEHPFVHLLIDYGQYCPDTWSYHADEAHHAIYQRLHDTSEGAPVFRKTSISVPHWQIHNVGEAYEYLSKSAPIDILYVDWMTWLEKFIDNKATALPDMMTHYANKIRDGGLVILDHKHKFMGEDGCRWYNHPGGTFPIGEHAMMEEVCTIEWMGWDFSGDVQTYSATVFKIHHSSKGPLGNTDWNEAIKPWFWKSIPEMALNEQQVQKLIEADHSETIHPHATTWENWHDTWMTVHEVGSAYSTVYQTPVPAQKAWPKASYMEYLQWLVEHPQCLLPTVEKRSYKLQGENFILNLIHGDLLELAPTLYTKHSALAVRNNLQQQVVNRCPWWKKQTTILQSKQSWETNPVKGLKWSGKDATKHLAKILIEQSKVQAYSATIHNLPSFECRQIVTVAHGNATLLEVMKAVEAYYEELGWEYPRPTNTLELTIVYLDENEYSSEKTAIGPRNWVSHSGKWRHML